MNIVLLGIPGAGKGTQARLLSEKLGVPHISTGEILRSESKKGTALGEQAKKIMEEGTLLPDEVINRIVKDRLRQEDCKNGYILDGYPRTKGQAEYLDNLVKTPSSGKTTSNGKIEYVFHLDLDEEEVIKRLMERTFCSSCGRNFSRSYQDKNCPKCGGAINTRKDDRGETIKARLEEYQTRTEPLLRYYKDKKTLHYIDGSRSINEVFAQIMPFIGQQ